MGLPNQFKKNIFHTRIPEFFINRYMEIENYKIAIEK